MLLCVTCFLLEIWLTLAAWALRVWCASGLTPHTAAFAPVWNTGVPVWLQMRDADEGTQNTAEGPKQAVRKRRVRKDWGAPGRPALPCAASQHAGSPASDQHGQPDSHQPLLPRPPPPAPAHSTLTDQSSSSDIVHLLVLLECFIRIEPTPWDFFRRHQTRPDKVYLFGKAKQNWPGCL